MSVCNHSPLPINAFPMISNDFPLFECVGWQDLCSRLPLTAFIMICNDARKQIESLQRSLFTIMCCVECCKPCSTNIIILATTIRLPDCRSALSFQYSNIYWDRESSIMTIVLFAFEFILFSAIQLATSNGLEIVLNHRTQTV